jgi:hypothetical protein
MSLWTEFFALLRSVVTTPAASGAIPKVSWACVLKATFLCAKEIILFLINFFLPQLFYLVKLVQSTNTQI